MLSYDCAICNDPLAGATRCLQSGDARQETCSGKSMRIDWIYHIYMNCKPDFVRPLNWVCLYDPLIGHAFVTAGYIIIYIYIILDLPVRGSFRLKIGLPLWLCGEGRSKFWGALFPLVHRLGESNGMFESYYLSWCLQPALFRFVQITLNHDLYYLYTSTYSTSCLVYALSKTFQARHKHYHDHHSTSSTSSSWFMIIIIPCLISPVLVPNLHHTLGCAREAQFGEYGTLGAIPHRAGRPWVVSHGGSA